MGINRAGEWPDTCSASTHRTENELNLVNRFASSVRSVVLKAFVSYPTESPRLQPIRLHTSGLHLTRLHLRILESFLSE